MWNGNVGKVRAFCLATMIVSTGGCELSASPMQGPETERGAPESALPNLRHQADPARNRVWFLTADGVILYDAATLEKITVRLPDWQWAGAPYGCLPDLALGPKGEAVITSDILPTLWRIDPDTLAVSVHPLALDADTDKDVGFSGIVYSSGQGAYYAVSNLHGSLWRIDPLFERAQKIALSELVQKACGVALQPRIAERKTVLPAGLCVRTPQGGSSVDFAPDQRSAYVRTAACAPR